MEILGALEEKIKRLVALVQDLKAQNQRLIVDNTALKERINEFEQKLSKRDGDFKEWDKEKAFAKKAVDDLIADIDSLIESGSR